MTELADLRDKCAIVGVGETPYTRGTDKSTLRLHLEAAYNAIEDAGLSPKDIDGYLESAPHHGVLHEDIILNLGIPDLKYYATIRKGGAGVVASFTSAVLAITSGACNYMLTTVGKSGYSEQRASAMAGRQVMPTPHREFSKEFEAPYGVYAPVQLFTFAARRHMYEYGTTSRQLGAIAVACRKHAMLNPKAVMRKPMTIEDHQNSRMIVDPLRLFDCSLETDGAGAVVVTSAERARNLKHRPVYITGVAQGNPDRPFSEITKIVMTELPGVRKAAKRAFAMAGLTPKDVDVAEIYDAFTWTCLTGIEDVGFCKKGEGGAFVEGGRIELGGELPVNTHGGLLSEAHVTGVNHVIEAVRQLRGDCGERQVKNAEIALVEGEGDFGEGGVMLLRR